jgi:hypothetical protein
MPFQISSWGRPFRRQKLWITFYFPQSNGDFARNHIYSKKWEIKTGVKKCRITYKKISIANVLPQVHGTVHYKRLIQDPGWLNFEKIVEDVPVNSVEKRQKARKM